MNTIKCKSCQEYFEVTANTKRKIFCNRKCSAQYNNKRRIVSESTRLKYSENLKNRIKVNGPLTSGETAIKYGSDSQKGKHNKEIKSIYECSSRTREKIIKRLKMGCSRCGWSEGNGDIHHINGRKIEDANNMSNLCYLCPNCHRLCHEGKILKESLIPLSKTIPENWKEYYYG